MLLEPCGANPHFQKTENFENQVVRCIFFVFAFLAYFIFCHFLEERDIILDGVSKNWKFIILVYILHTHMCACACICIYYIGYIYGKCIYYLVYIFLGYILIMLKFS